MVTQYVPVRSAVETVTLPYYVSQPHDGIGSNLAYSGATDSITIWQDNPEPAQSIFYRIGAGDWKELHGRRSTSIEIDLSQATIAFKCGPFTPPTMCRIEAWGKPSTLVTKAGQPIAGVGGAGQTGPVGPPGPQGLPGIPGAKGDQGDTGNTGSTGPMGPAGQAGIQGLTGSTGPQGQAGENGSVGPQGPPGAPGAVGSVGGQGPQGPSGTAGATGPQGPIGLTGPAGAQGIQGLTGNTGAQGPIGLTGNAGPQGLQGLAGATGSQGPIGNTGPQGIQGPIGLTGSQGPAGGGLRVALASDVINNNGVANTIADVTGLSFPVVANTRYKFRFQIIYTSAAATTGSRWSINGPATTELAYRSSYTLSAAGRTFNEGLGAYNLPAASNASSIAANNMSVIQGVIRPSANGNVIARFASEILSSAITAKAGMSFVEYEAIA